MPNVEKIFRVLFFRCKYALEHCCVGREPTFTGGWVSSLCYISCQLFCALFPRIKLLFVLLKSFKYLIIFFEFHYTRHFMGKIPISTFFFLSPLFHKYNALDQFISSFPSTIKIIFKNLLMERNFFLLNHYHPIKYPPLISFIT